VFGGFALGIWFRVSPGLSNFCYFIDGMGFLEGIFLCLKSLVFAFLR